MHESSVRGLNATRELLYVDRKTLVEKREALGKKATVGRVAAIATAVRVAQKLQGLAVNKASTISVGVEMTVYPSYAAKSPCARSCYLELVWGMRCPSVAVSSSRVRNMHVLNFPRYESEVLGTTKSDI